MLSKLQKLREEREQGFTLIELLVVILIIGILAAIAIPAFLNQRKSAVDSSVQADVSNAAKQIETLAIKAGGQNTAITLSGNTLTVGTGNTMQLEVSDGTVLRVTGSTGSGYFIQGTNPGGDIANETATSPVTSTTGGFIYDSANGGLKSN